MAIGGTISTLSKKSKSKINPLPISNGPKLLYDKDTISYSNFFKGRSFYLLRPFRCILGAMAMPLSSHLI